jgi:hypothetical protein
MSLQDFLVWLASSAGATAALSFIAERIPAFTALTPNQKQYIHLGGSLVLSLAAYAVLTYVPAETLASLAPVFQVVYGVVVSWIANQVAHKADPRA